MNYFSDMTRVTREATRAPLALTERVFDLGDFLRLLNRRRPLILGFVAASLLIAYLVLQWMTPIYTGTAELFLEKTQTNITDIKAVLTEAVDDPTGLSSEIEVLRSRGLADKVVDKLRLTEDPEFNKALLAPSPIERARQRVAALASAYVSEDFLVWIGLIQPDQLTPEEEQLAQQEKTVNAFLKRLSVFPKGESRVINVSFDSESPTKAAQIANAVADAYILDQLDQRYEATRRANEWLGSKLDDLRTKVARSDGAVESYRQRAGLIQGGQGSLLVSQQVTDLNSQLIIARTERAAAEARLSQVRQLVRAQGGADAARDVLSSPIVQALSAQETEVKRKLAELEQEYGERHPRLINVKAELRDVRAKLNAEVGKVVRTLENEVAVAQAREAALAQSLRQVEGRVSQANTASVQLRALEREANADKQLLELFLNRAEQINAQTDLAIHQSNARILSKATLPHAPSSPQKALMMAVILVASTLFVILAVLVIEFLHRGFRSGEQIEEMTGVRALGLIPAIKNSRRKGRQPELVLVKQPQSLFGEAVRSVYTSILFSQTQEPLKTILITSSYPKEGKTTLAVCLARMCALSGKRTVLVEADLRKPQVHRRISAPQGPGLVEYFLGEAELSQILHYDEVSGAYVIPCGKASVDASKLLDSPEMSRLLASLAAQFDLVLLDTPPIMAVADARILTPQVDGVVYAVRWAKTPREVVKLGLKTLGETTGHVVGAVLTMVDVEQHAQYGFGDSGYYHKGIKSYYVRG
ncbi:conserved hypothetical protein [Candidatus Defluviicoccus seviourii]|uniref:non-specific protein-tyrosine kinase n=1 Tax=Candidatus Defluviicoccus seviourii TaxID=2565273 RepID=A0A564WEE3_9PROT|nr:conserved hypothetical protein [Candidatus Defluviicoccus seviourii]